MHPNSARLQCPKYTLNQSADRESIWPWSTEKLGWYVSNSVTGKDRLLVHQYVVLSIPSYTWHISRSHEAMCQVRT